MKNLELNNNDKIKEDNKEKLIPIINYNIILENGKLVEIKILKNERGEIINE